MKNPKIKNCDSIVLENIYLCDLNNRVVLFHLLVPIHNKSQSYQMKHD